MINRDFDIDSSIRLQFKAALYCIGAREDRDLCRRFALNVLNLTYQLKQPYDETTFTKMLGKIGRSLTDNQQSLVIGMCLDASTAYKEWCESGGENLDSEQFPARKQANRTGYSVPDVHGGSSHTGRLKVGSSAPYGSESYQSDDDPREGRAQWVKALTAAGSGAGYSLGELSGAKERKEFGSVISTEELRNMSKNRLVSLMDKATSPGNFIRAMLAYYKKSMIVPIGNISINSGDINNPENRKTASQLDSVYRFMQQMDGNKIMTSTRATRFLVLCNNLLLQVRVNAPRRDDRMTRETYDEKIRELRIAREDINYELKRASANSGVTINEMQRKIDSDKRKYIGDGIIRTPDTAIGVQTQATRKVSL